MKFKILFVLMFAFSLSVVADGDTEIEKGWSFYQENNKWGVKYKDEVCLLPRFSAVFGNVVSGKFIYKQGDKYGISTIWKSVAAPFCDSLVWMKEYNGWKPGWRFLKFKDGNKWGICSIDGKVIIQPKYDEILNSYYRYGVFGVYPSKYEKKDFPNYNRYFLVREGNSCKIIDLIDTEVVPNVTSFFENFDRKDKKEYQRIVICVKKNEWNRKDNGDLSKIKEMRQISDDAYSQNTLFGNYQHWDSRSWDIQERNEDMQKPRELYFGRSTRAFGDSAIVDGFKSIVNDYGFISTPLEYDTPYFKLKNNPYDVKSWLYYVEMERETNGVYTWLSKSKSWYISSDDIQSGIVAADIERMKNRLRAYKELLEMAKKYDPQSLDVVQQKTKELSEKIEFFEEEHSKGVKRLNSIARMDRIASNVSSVLNSLANVLSGTSNTASNRVSNGNSIEENNRDKSNSPLAKVDNKMSMSDQVNYNSLRNTYNKWASDLMQMKSLTGAYSKGYKESDKTHAQSEMKRLRKMAVEKWGKEIPYNSIENW